MKKRAIAFLRALPQYPKILYKKTIRVINKKPLTSFFVALGIVVVLIILSSFLHKPGAAEKATQAPAKPVQVYRIGSAPKITAQAQVKKSGVIQIVALGSGV